MSNDYHAPPFAQLLGAGLSAIPVKDDGSKRSAGPWKKYTKERATDATAKRWGKKYRGIAIIGGAVSGNLEILDIDDPGLVEPFEQALEAASPGLLSKLTKISTPRRDEQGRSGAHYPARYEVRVGGSMKLAMSESRPEVAADDGPTADPHTKQQKRKLTTSIETRGEGGYVLTIGCAPECHPTGNTYDHVAGPPLTELSVLTAENHEIIHRVARAFDQSIAASYKEPRERHDATGESPGDAYNREVAWEEVLEPEGWSKSHAHGRVQYWIRPGKNHGVSATTGMVSRDGNELMICFSTSAHPFKGTGRDGRAGISYTKFGAYALLHHGGDFSAAARELANLGYGTRRQESSTTTTDDFASIPFGDHELTLEFAPVGKSTMAAITARIGEEVVAVEKVDLGKSKQREAFAVKLCDGRSIDVAPIEAELLKQAARLTERAAKSNEPKADTAPAAPAGEVDVSQIARPERIITPEVSGLTVPRMMAAGDEIIGEWQVCLSWADGRRERRPLGSSIEMPKGSKLYIYPDPAEPSPSTKAGWTVSSRWGWFEGESAPNVADVFRQICKAIDRFIDFPDRFAKGTIATIALWVILTYCYHAWSAVPYLYIGGPLGSGKSRVFEVLSRLCFRPLATSNLTAASMFRSLHASGGTLLLDEAERLKQTRDPDTGEILSMLLAGYKVDGSALRLEPVGDAGFKTISFDVYGPKALACIAGLPPALASRAIAITMFRAAKGSDKPRRRIDAQRDLWVGLRNDLHFLALEHGPQFLELADTPDVCPRMSGRDFELWQPLLALASGIKTAGADGLLSMLQKHALSTIEVGQDAQVPDLDEVLLRVLAKEVQGGERPTPKDLLALARESEGEVFRNWSPKAVADHLARYGLRTMKTHGAKRYGRVSIDDLRRVQESYGYDLGIESEKSE